MQNQKGVGLSTNAGNAASQLTKTRLEYAPEQAGQAATVAEMMGLPKSALKENPSVGKSMKLTLGKDFKAGEPVAAPDEGAGRSPERQGGRQEDLREVTYSLQGAAGAPGQTHTA